MKKIIGIFTMVCLLFFSGCTSNLETINESEAIPTSLQSDIKFIKTKRNEVLVIKDLKNNNFKNYYLIQFENKPNFKKLIDDQYDIIEKDSYLMLENNKNKIVFSVHQHDNKLFENDTNVYFNYVYGFSKRFTGAKTLSIDPSSTKFFDDNPDMECFSGGEGSSACSTESGSPIGGNCSTTCRSTHYACCDDTINECKCVGNGQSPEEYFLSEEEQ